ncbi:MAG TPA: amino acid permease [Symbiobacteriaceae bacterium]|jgi:amino acid transporter
MQPKKAPESHGQVSKDIQDLHQFGYAQELFREMGGFSNFAISFSIISILTGAVTLYGFGINMGGPGVMGFGWPLVTIFVLFISASMAELSSAIPTSGALYHWSSVLGGKAWGWFTAWFNLIGQMTITAGIDFGVASFAAPLLGMAENQTNFLIVYAVILVMHGLLNHYGIRLVARLNDFSAIYHMAGVVVLVIALTFFVPKHDVSLPFLLGKHGDTTYPYWWAFMLALLQAQWTYTGYDASAHVTEETVDPRRRGPWGVYLSVAVSAIFGYVMLLAVTASIQDLPAVMGATNPYIAAIEGALGTAWGRAMLWMVTLAMWFCGLASVTANSRMIYAFARDGGMPFSGAWATVSKKYRTPVNAIWMSVVVAFLFAVWADAYSVITSVSVVALYVSYLIPVALKLIWQAKGQWKQEHFGPWNLGSWSPVVNVISMIWGVIVTILFVVPPNEKAGYAMGGSLVFLLIYWFAFEKNRFQGPRAIGAEEELAKIEAELEKQSIYKEAGVK